MTKPLQIQANCHEPSTHGSAAGSSLHKAPAKSLRRRAAVRAGESQDPYAWIHCPHGRVFNNLSFPGTAQSCRELAEITGVKLMRAAAAAGAKVAIFDARNQWYALHDSEVLRKHPGLGDRDLVAELIEAGRRLGITYVPYLPMDCDLRDWK